jgi:hypothetical protein
VATLNKNKLLGAGLVGLFIGSPAHAVLITVDFEADTPEVVANGFTSSGAPGVSFSDEFGSDLEIGNFGTLSNGSQALANGTPFDASFLLIDFDFLADFLSLDFGNDDPFLTNPGDMAVLRVFLGATQVGQAVLGLNRNELMDQTIAIGSLGGALQFDSASFAFTNSALSPITGGGSAGFGLTEIVDNIRVSTVESVSVPEPSTLVLLAAGLAALGATRRKAAATIAS